MKSRKSALALMTALMTAATLAGCSGIPDGVSKEVYEIGCEALSVAETANKEGNIFTPSTVSRLEGLDEELESALSGTDEDQTANTYVGQIAVGAKVGSQGMVDTGISGLKSALGKD